jgi:hypothetical protein
MLQKSEPASIAQLREISVLRDLQVTDIIALQPNTTIRLYQKGEVVMYEGDQLSPQLYTLIAGTLSSYLTIELRGVLALPMQNVYAYSVNSKQLYPISVVE